MTFHWYHICCHRCIHTKSWPEENLVSCLHQIPTLLISLPWIYHKIKVECNVVWWMTDSKNKSCEILLQILGDPYDNYGILTILNPKIPSGNIYKKLMCYILLFFKAKYSNVLYIYIYFLWNVLLHITIDEPWGRLMTCDQREIVQSHFGPRKGPQH